MKYSMKINPQIQKNSAWILLIVCLDDLLTNVDDARRKVDGSGKFKHECLRHQDMNEQLAFGQSKRESGFSLVFRN